MKTRFAIIFLALALSAVGQPRPNKKPYSTVYLCYQPADHGFGLGGEYYFNPYIGAYASASYGNWGLYQFAGYKNHIKATIGGIIPIRKYRDDYAGILVGVNYHYVKKKDDYVCPVPINQMAVERELSFEIGLTFRIRRIVMGLRTDILRWEPCVNIGFPIAMR